MRRLIAPGIDDDRRRLRARRWRVTSLSMKGNGAPRGMGIVGEDFLATLRNFRRLAKEIKLDDVILKMLIERDNVSS